MHAYRGSIAEAMKLLEDRKRWEAESSKEVGRTWLLNEHEATERAREACEAVE